MSVYGGACHCVAVSVRFETAIDPAAIDVRADQCGFCRRHGAKTVSDPAGRLALAFREAAVERYRFGTRSSDFIVCRACGAYVAAIIEGYGVLNVVAADIRAFADKPARPVDYDEETAAVRLARRRERWTPLTLEIAA
ncbi:MAG TPA: aldehyde-activating protein [Caulobacteraceae bacterium]|nr:aldehyde-activating protein [Caulobacteraceae bacterium]